MRLGLDTDDDASLWRDRAAFETNRAVTTEVLFLDEDHFLDEARLPAILPPTRA